MNAFWGAIAVIAALFFTSLHAYAFPNEPDGFRGLKWGTPFKSVSHQFYGSGEAPEGQSFLGAIADSFDSAVSSPPNGDYVLYKRKTDSLRLNNVEVMGISYAFYRGYLAYVELVMDFRSQSLPIHWELNKFGRSMDNIVTVAGYPITGQGWIGDTTTVTLFETERGNRLYLRIASSNLEHFRRSEDAKASRREGQRRDAEEAKKDHGW